MKKVLRISAVRVASILLGIAISLPAAADIIFLESSLDGAQASAGAGTGSPGTGSAEMTFDDATNLFSWDIIWQDLTTEVFAAHFHGPALPTQNAGVEVTIDVLSPIGSATLTNVQAADLLAGLWYINVHTLAFGPGEIRGQVRFSIVPVTIDIKPGSDPNNIKPAGNKKIPVAILTTGDFSAQLIDPLSVQFGPDGATESHGRAHVEDVDDDGDMDMLLHFNTQDTGIVCGDTHAALTGETFGGQSIDGSDSIVTVKCD